MTIDSNFEPAFRELLDAVSLVNIVTEQIVADPNNRLTDAHRRTLDLTAEIIVDRTADIGRAIGAPRPKIGTNDGRLRELAAEWRALEDSGRAKDDAGQDEAEELAAQDKIEKVMATLATALSAATAEAFGTKPRIVQVGCQDMEPELRRGDFVLALPVDGFVHDGLYVLDIHHRNVPDVWYASSLGPHGINLRKVRRDLTPDERVSRAEFQDMVVGLVIARINVLERRHFPYPAN